MDDPALAVSYETAVEISADIQVQLEAKNGCRPVLALLAKARRRASTAVANLIYETGDLERVRVLQVEIRVFTHTVEMLRELLAEGLDGDFVIDERERSELETLIGGELSLPAEMRNTQ
jgi:hypothetical protein